MFNHSHIRFSECGVNVPDVKIYRHRCLYRRLDNCDCNFDNEFYHKPFIYGACTESTMVYILPEYRQKCAFMRDHGDLIPVIIKAIYAAYMGRVSLVRHLIRCSWCNNAYIYCLQSERKSDNQAENRKGSEKDALSSFSLSRTGIRERKFRKKDIDRKEDRLRL